MKKPTPQTANPAANKAYDPEDESGANTTAQIAIAACSVVYLGIFIFVVLDLTKYSMKQFLIIFAFYAAAVLLNLVLYPVLTKKAPRLYKYFLLGVLFVAGISLQATTQLLGALFLSFPILLACRYHDRRFMLFVIVASFLSVIVEALICLAIGIFDLNAVSVLDNTVVTDGRHFQTFVMPYVDREHFLSDVFLFSVLPQWAQLGVITVVAMLLGRNGRALRAHQREAIRKEAAVEHELNSAREIQMGLLPDKFDIGKGFDLFASSLPAKNVGGDFYDCFMTDDRHLAVVIADVSDKGMPAALFMATTKMCIRDYAAMGLGVGEVFTRVNRAVCDGNKQGMFVTAWLGLLDLTTGDMDFVNAGHNPPLVRNTESGFYFLSMKTNIILGAFEEHTYASERLKLAPGDALVLYTDGVTESRNAAGELFGNERLARLLNGLAGASSAQTVRAVNGGVAEFAGGEAQYDDVTVLALRYLGLPAENNAAVSTQ